MGNRSFVYKILITFSSGDRCNQELGSIATKKGRCLAFPNIYQHQVSSFRLEDPSKPGYRKILVFFLVDPTYRIPSASSVAPQQRQLIYNAIRGADANSLFCHLPVELIEKIMKFVPGLMSRQEAEEYRLDLMKERAVFVGKNNSRFFGHVRGFTLLVFSQLTNE